MSSSLRAGGSGGCRPTPSGHLGRPGAAPPPGTPLGARPIPGLPGTPAAAGAARPFPDGGGAAGRENQPAAGLRGKAGGGAGGEGGARLGTAPAPGRPLKGPLRTPARFKSKRLCLPSRSRTQGEGGWGTPRAWGRGGQRGRAKKVREQPCSSRFLSQVEPGPQSRRRPGTPSPVPRGLNLPERLWGLSFTPSSPAPL